MTTTPVKEARRAKTYAFEPGYKGYGLQIGVQARSKDEAIRIYEKANPEYAKAGGTGKLKLMHDPTDSWRSWVRHYGRQSDISI